MFHKFHINVDFFCHPKLTQANREDKLSYLASFAKVGQTKISNVQRSKVSQHQKHATTQTTLLSLGTHLNDLSLQCSDLPT